MPRSRRTRTRWCPSRIVPSDRHFKELSRPGRKESINSWSESRPYFCSLDAIKVASGCSGTNGGRSSSDTSDVPYSFDAAFRRREKGWGCPEPPGTVLMAAPSGLTRFILSRRSGPHPFSRRAAADVCRPSLHQSTSFRGAKGRRLVERPGLLLRLTAGKDARHEGQDVGGTRLIITVIADQALLDDVDLLLGCLVHHV